MVLNLFYVCEEIQRIHSSMLDQVSIRTITRLLPDLFMDVV
jgi:hypothetical protein